MAVSDRGSGGTTVEFDSVQVMEGVVAISGVESAGTDNMVLMTWLPIAGAAGYNIYRGAGGASLDQMTLLNTAAPHADAFYFDNAASDTLLRTLSYVVAPVFRRADNTTFEGPAVRVR